MLNPLKAAIIGYGDRGDVYASYALKFPDELEIASVVEPNEKKRENAILKFGIKRENAFTNVSDFLNSKPDLDFVINTTMDSLHYETTVPLLENAYNVLLEKPVTNKKTELLELADLAKKKGCKLSVCHVLRYTPFYSSIKEKILQGLIGEIMSIETSEAVGVYHYLCAYNRGKWRNEAECGSSMLLAKCCHDLDLTCWLNNASSPRLVNSFGGRDFFVKEKAPDNSGSRCLIDCPLVDECIYSAKKVSVDNNFFAYYVYGEFFENYENPPAEDRIELLKTSSNFGVCAYKTDSDVVDHQVVSLQFVNGSTAVHSMIAGATRPCRRIHVYGTKGEIDGCLEDNIFNVKIFNPDNGQFDQETIDVSQAVNSGHSGGDEAIVRDFVRYINGLQVSISSTGITDSINGHLCVFAADKSMTDERTVIIDI